MTEQQILNFVTSLVALVVSAVALWKHRKSPPQ